MKCEHDTGKYRRHFSFSNGLVNGISRISGLADGEKEYLTSAVDATDEGNNSREAKELKAG